MEVPLLSPTSAARITELARACVQHSSILLAQSALPLA